MATVSMHIERPLRTSTRISEFQPLSLSYIKPNPMRPHMLASVMMETHMAAVMAF